MAYKTSIMLALTATTVLGQHGFAAESQNQQAAQHDFGKLSVQGALAMRDVHEARLDIFNGRIVDAGKKIILANTALGKAKTDDTAFLKAEGDLKAPSGMTQPQTGTVTTGTVSWLPVDGTMLLDEDYKASQTKADSVAKANTQIKAGDKAGAMETLRLADIGVSFSLEVVPLNKTVTQVQLAAQDFAAGKYYEANQDLKAVDDSVRFDTETAVMAPTKATAAH